MITKDMLIMEALQQGDPDKIAAVLQESGMEEAAAVHGIDVEELVAKLNAAL